MRSLSKLLVIGGLSIFLIVAIVGIGVWTIATNRPAHAPQLILKDSVAIANNTNITPNSSTQTVSVQQTAAEREAQYKQRIQALQTAIQTRQTEYQTQIASASEQLQNYQTDITQKEENLAALNIQADEMNTEVTTRQASYETQLTQTKSEFAQRKAQFVAQVQEAQAALSAVWAQLGR